MSRRLVGSSEIGLEAETDSAWRREHRLRQRTDGRVQDPVAVGGVGREDVGLDPIERRPIRRSSTSRDPVTLIAVNGVLRSVNW